MTTVFTKETDPYTERYFSDLESALFSRAIANSGADLPPERHKALLRQWLLGTFNASSHDTGGAISGTGEMQWIANGDEIRLLYNGPGGVTCHLARIYPQPDQTWAAIVVAGVRDDPYSAMAAAEWAVSRLAA